MQPYPVQQSRYYCQYRHMWHVPRGYSIIDVALNRVLLLLAFSLPLEGILQDFTGSTGRSLAFYLAVVAVGLAFLRIPQVLYNVGNAHGYILLVGVYAWTLILYYFFPLIDNNTNKLLIQLIILGGIFLYVSDRRDLRNRLLWAYWLGWMLLVLWSLSSYAHGDYQLWEHGSVIRVAQISGYTANQHARQIAAGMLVTFTLLLTQRRILIRFVGVVIFVVAAFVLLITNSRGGISSLLLTLGLFFMAQPLYARSSRRFATLGVLIVLLVFGLQYVFFETSDGRRFWNSYVLRVNQLLYAENDSSRERIAQATIDVFWEKPLGVGQQNSQAYLRERLGSAYDPHNYYLRILAEAGLPGTIMFAAGLYMVVRNGWRWLIYSGEDQFFWPLLYFLIAAATGRDFHFKVFWFFLAMNAYTPASSQSRSPVSVD